DVRVLPGLRLARELHPDGVDRDRGDGRAGRHGPRARRDPGRDPALRHSRDAARSGQAGPDGAVRHRSDSGRGAAHAALRPVAGADHGVPAHRHLARAQARHPAQHAEEPGMSELLLSVKGVNKRFGGLQALSDVGLEIRRGQIYGLIGPNGAGKTTFFNVITGLYTPDSGSFELEGEAYEPTAVHKVAQAGIARTFQNIRLFGEMTAIENVMVGRHVRTKAGVVGAIFRTGGQRTEE